MQTWSVVSGIEHMTYLHVSRRKNVAHVLLVKNRSCPLFVHKAKVSISFVFFREHYF